MRVSIALHVAEPTTGNQESREAVYGGYNRQYATLNTLTGVCDFSSGVTFPRVLTDACFVEFVSIGVCEGVPQGEGGRIIGYMSLIGLLTCALDTEPNVAALFNVTAEQMREAGVGAAVGTEGAE